MADQNLPGDHVRKRVIHVFIRFSPRGHKNTRIRSLEKEYLPEHNRHFARAAAQPEDYLGRKPTARELRQIFRLETERTISNDWVIRHNGRNLQLRPGQRRYGPTQSKALVGEWEDGAMEVYYRGERMAYAELSEAVPKAPRPVPSAARVMVVKKAKKGHPWRRGYQNMKPGSEPGDRTAARWNTHLHTSP